MKEVEFYEERQGRPLSTVTLDMETRQPSIPAGGIAQGQLFIGEDYVKASDLQELINKMNEKIEELRVEMVQVKLHLASLSDEPITERDAEQEDE